MNTYNPKTGERKQEAREIMVESIIDSNAPYGVIPSFPNVNWTIEKMIMRYTKRFHFHAVECDGKTYDKMVDTMRENNWRFPTHPGKLSEVLNGAKENAFSHVIADYCGMFHKIYRDLEAIFGGNLIAKDGTVSLTLTTRLTGKFRKNKYWKFAAKKPKGVTKTEHMVRALVANYPNYEVETVFGYSDPKKDKKGKMKKGAPMILMVIKRIK